MLPTPSTLSKMTLSLKISCKTCQVYQGFQSYLRVAGIPAGLGGQGMTSALPLGLGHQIAVLLITSTALSFPAWTQTHGKNDSACFQSPQLHI